MGPVVGDKKVGNSGGGGGIGSVQNGHGRFNTALPCVDCDIKSGPGVDVLRRGFFYGIHLKRWINELWQSSFRQSMNPKK